MYDLHSAGGELARKALEAHVHDLDLGVQKGSGSVIAFVRLVLHRVVLRTVATVCKKTLTYVNPPGGLPSVTRSTRAAFRG